MSGKRDEAGGGADRGPSKIARSRDLMSDPIETQALRRALAQGPLAARVSLLSDVHLIREVGRIGTADALSTGPRLRLPRIKHAAVPAPEVAPDGAVAEPEPLAAEVSDPPLCEICLKAAAASGSPLMTGSRHDASKSRAA